MSVLFNKKLTKKRFIDSDCKEKWKQTSFTFINWVEKSAVNKKNKETIVIVQSMIIACISVKYLKIKFIKDLIQVCYFISFKIAWISWKIFCINKIIKIMTKTNKTMVVCRKNGKKNIESFAS